MADKRCPHCGEEMMSYSHSDEKGKVTQRWVCVRGGVCKLERTLKELARRRAA
jgi:ribosomal protein S27AE